MIALLLALAAIPPAPLRCGAVERPGIATRGSDGVWRGIAIDLCRQAARSESGPGAAIAFRPYRHMADLRDAANDALAVLSPAELAIAQSSANMPPLHPPSAPVATSRQILLVRPGTPLRNPSDLANHRVCFIIATAAEAALNAWARAHVEVQRVGFQETIELRDAFDVGHCAAIAVDAQDIPGGAERTMELGPALAEVPLFVVRPSEKAR